MVQNTNPRMIRITPHTDAQIPQPRLLDTAIVERRSKEEEGEGVRRELGFFFPQSRGLVQSCRTSFFNPSLLERNFNEVKRPPSWLILSKKMVFVHFVWGWMKCSHGLTIARSRINLLVTTRQILQKSEGQKRERERPKILCARSRSRKMSQLLRVESKSPAMALVQGPFALLFIFIFMFSLHNLIFTSCRVWKATRCWRSAGRGV